VQVLANSCVNFFAFPPNNTPDAPCNSPDSFPEGSPSDATIFTPGGASVTKDLLFGGGVVTGFLTAVGPLGTVTFDLESVIASGQPACPAMPSGLITCSIGLFTLSQQNFDPTNVSCPPGVSPCGQVSVAFGFNADAYTVSHASGFTPYVMNYTSQFNHESVADLINKAGTGSGSTGGIFNSVSLTANPVAPVPEPTGFVLIGAGLIGISLIARRRVRSRA